MMNIGLLYGFIGWWYSEGIKKIFNFLGAFFRYLLNTFSVDVIFKTFFQPWKRLVGARRPGLDGLRDWFLDNLISRLVGATVRFFLLIFFVITCVLFVIFSSTAFLFWLIFPIFLPLSLIWIFWS